MGEFYGGEQLRLQRQFDADRLAGRLEALIVTPAIDAASRQFIESRPMFFLSTLDHRGFPSCSYKGGEPGFVRVLDEKTLVFPSYDGNGMFFSLGNIAGHARIGMLFIDFEVPHRLRLHGTARIDAQAASLSDWPGAELLVQVRVEEVFVNCPRYIHKHRRTEISAHAPASGKQVAPAQWKRIDLVQDVLPERDRGVADAAGGTVGIETYMGMVARGEG